MTDFPERRRQGEESDLNQRLDLLITRADSIDGSLAADKLARETENVLRDRRIRYSQIAIAVALGIAAFAIISAHIQHDNDLRDTSTRRVAFCRSLEDVGAASEAAANGAAEGTLKTFFDPALAQPGAPVTPQETIDLFTQLLREHTKDSVHVATAAAISSVKAKNGFSEDCRILNPSSSTDTGWIAALFLLGLLILIFIGLFGAFVLAARRSARTIQRQ